MDGTGVAVAVREGLFTDSDPPRLLGSRCTSCGCHHFPRHDTCPYCAADGTTPVELSDTGTLWSWTTVTTAPPGYGGDVPYGFGVVELPEGLRVVSRLTEADPSLLSAGQPMALVVVPVGVDDDGHRVVTYAFAPQAEHGGPVGGSVGS
ncbi:MAG TPA: OB-fold domain-containing protein [Acidimicrobiales bacterium]